MLETKITTDMIDELNKQFESAGSIIRIRPSEVDPDRTFKVAIVSEKYVDGFNIYLDDEGRSLVIDFFRRYGIKLSWNNTRTIFWENFMKNTD